MGVIHSSTKPYYRQMEKMFTKITKGEFNKRHPDHTKLQYLGHKGQYVGSLNGLGQLNGLGRFQYPPNNRYEGYFKNNVLEFGRHIFFGSQTVWEGQFDEQGVCVKGRTRKVAGTITGVIGDVTEEFFDRLPEMDNELKNVKSELPKPVINPELPKPVINPELPKPVIISELPKPKLESSELPEPENESDPHGNDDGFEIIPENNPNPIEAIEENKPKVVEENKPKVVEEKKVTPPKVYNPKPATYYNEYNDYESDDGYADNDDYDRIMEGGYTETEYHDRYY